ncbi:MAG: hypothetical protein CLLPBCKN_001168 [Chroococcidiopsis cubana SAG 39.79]|nr:hypothetical protein [Chroococcidiopsis cubana SAG 39.79]
MKTEFSLLKNVSNRLTSIKTFTPLVQPEYEHGDRGLHATRSYN